MYVSWVKCGGDVWCSLDALDLESDYFQNSPEGVYVIWHGGPNPHTVYVGQGDIKTRIQAHRLNTDFGYFRSSGLYVSWTIVVPSLRNGIEAYLADLLKPLAGTHHPIAQHIAVNLPLW